MTARIVVFGATGYTGRLVTRELVAAGHRPVVAGRDQRKVRALATAHGNLEVAFADAADPASVAALVGPGDVLVTTVGPFSRYGRPALDAAIAAGARYLDCTGEASFIHHVFTEAGPRARASGATLLTAVGFDYLPGNLAGALALRAAGEAARRVDVAYFMGGSLSASSGTRATGILMAGEPVYCLQAGAVVARPVARQVRHFPSPGRARPAALWGGSEPFTLPHLAPGLTDVATFVGGPDRLIRPAQALSFPLAGLLRLPPGRWLWEKISAPALRVSGQGPDAETRARATACTIAVARDEAGRELASVRLEGRDPYTFTGRMMAWIAGHLATGNVTEAGALGPVDAFGIDELERAVAAAGIRRVE